MSKYQPGDTVRLKSGGPLMTVIETEDGFVTCEWFDGDGNAHEKSFTETSLTADTNASP